MLQAICPYLFLLALGGVWSIDFGLKGFVAPWIIIAVVWCLARIK